jgi:2-methylcitrate dehydratase PrpD
MLDGQPSIEHFTDGRVSSDMSKKLIERVQVRPYKKVEKLDDHDFLYAPHKVLVKLFDGRTYSSEVRFPKGCPQNPMSFDELLMKYKDCACVSLSKSEIEHSLDMLPNLERLESISQLSKLITKVINS